MKEAAAPFAVTVILVVASAISAAIVCDRVVAYAEARAAKRLKRNRQRAHDKRTAESPAGDQLPTARTDAGDGQLPDRTPEGLSVYVAWGIDAAQAFVVSLAPPAFVLIGLQTRATQILGVAYLASTLLGLALFAWVLHCDPDDYCSKRWANGVITPVVIVALVLNILAFVIVQETVSR